MIHTAGCCIVCIDVTKKKQSAHSKKLSSLHCVYRHVKLIQIRRGSLFYDLSHFNTSVASSRLIMIITWEPSTASRSLLVKKNISTERERRDGLLSSSWKSRTLRSSFRCFRRKFRRRPFVCALLLLIMQAKDKWMRRHKKRTLESK